MPDNLFAVCEPRADVLQGNRAHMAAVAAGIEAMSKEEAGYWLGMAMHRKYPRRVLMSLRFPLIEPAR